MAPWVTLRPSLLWINPIVPGFEKLRSPQKYVKIAYDEVKSVASIPWKVFVCEICTLA